MKRLTVLRHAKSGWDDPVARDFDRGLNQRGRLAAKRVGEFAREPGLDVDFIIASPAVRVTQTLDIFLPAAKLDRIEPHWDRRVYLASSVTLMDCLSDLGDDINHVLMAGHNPGLEDLILELVPADGSSPLRTMIEDNFPTGALATIELDIAGWKEIKESSGKLVSLALPRQLDPDLSPEDD
jgi:phosphohistidine phosphatase